MKHKKTPLGYTTDEKQMEKMKLLAIDIITKYAYFVLTMILSALQGLLHWQIILSLEVGKLTCLLR